MKMIEGIDSSTQSSSQDLWEQICPYTPEDHQLNHIETFSDSFQCVATVGETEFNNSSEPAHNSPYSAQKPWAPLQDSEAYLASLERRLQKIKGLSQEVTSKDMIRSLSQAKKECWDRFLQENFEHEAYIESSEVDGSTLEQLRRWLQPEKVAINAEEIQCLIPTVVPTEEGVSTPDPESAEQ
ncbi:coiled-coil domain-containing protein 32 [Bombina bombina]|uniref:coiled-coil domain-containing protein 32 n=1 Tax=Bombina bombina TaxID=8345 RepID=UPI00235AA8E4|nr:coiled-coil domain-containing protein 32 [Bombina bombina]XP_053553867.1 coiled-coil domain-containing protein 32 [Bombina bombina]